jgi:hypothetical protein
MKPVLQRLLSAVLLCAWAGAVLAVEIELGPVGNDAPAYLWCNQATHKVRTVVPGNTLEVTFRGRALVSSSGEARIHFPPGSDSERYFMWSEVLDSDADHSPGFNFGPVMTVLVGPRPRKLQVKPGAPAGLHYVRFIGVDQHGAETSPTQGCLLEVVSQLPDVEVADLRYDPPETGVSGRTVRMTVRNNATALVAVPWSISFSTRNSPFDPVWERVLSSGVQNNVPPGGSFDVTTHYTISSRHANPLFDHVIGRVNLDNFIGENDAQQTNNQKSIGDYPPLPPPPPVLVTQELDFVKAKANGARFQDNVESNGGCFRLGVDDWATARFVEQKSGAIFISNCAGGGRASPEAYLDFRLKNGWRIKSVHEDLLPHRGGNGFSLTWKPQIGSDNPYMHAHIWSGFVANISVGVRITIEGPAGTDPYVEGSTCPAGCSLSNSICIAPGTTSGTAYSCAVHQDCGDAFACDSSSGRCIARCSP